MKSYTYITNNLQSVPFECRNFLKIFLLYSSTQKPSQETSSSSGGWGWGGWASVLSQATASVTSGLSSVIETVETSLGVPDPEEMARKVRGEEQAVKEKALEKRKEDKTLVESNNENVNKDAASGGYRQNNVDEKKYILLKLSARHSH